MRKEYRKAVRELFSRRLDEMLPNFHAVKLKSPLLFGGESVFRWAAGGELVCFVILVPDPKGRQSFTVELGWSGLGRFPEGSSRPTLMLGPDDPDPVDVEEGIVRLGNLASRDDSWWDLPDPTLERPGDLRVLQSSMEPIDSAIAIGHAEGPVNAALDVLVQDGHSFLRTWVHART
ncbi:MAG: hypothetical protein OEO79_11065 [Gemmatimonadota bacterium]|nr:hypothetical protein [Gemmatimonadota bacterium]MDH3423866.1 hypothetical protein [Gemmatimonadota bacterium]